MLGRSCFQYMANCISLLYKNEGFTGIQNQTKSAFVIFVFWLSLCKLFHFVFTLLFSLVIIERYDKTNYNQYFPFSVVIYTNWTFKSNSIFYFSGLTGHICCRLFNSSVYSFVNSRVIFVAYSLGVFRGMIY